MSVEITKEQLLEAVFEKRLLLRGDIIAVTKTGSRLYNLQTEKSDYDFKIIYWPTAENIYYNEKQIEAFKLDIEGTIVEGQLISFNKFLLDIGKPSLNSIEVLYDDDWYVDRLVEDVYAEDFLYLYELLRSHREDLFYLNKGGMYNTLKGQLFNRNKKLSKAKKPEKEFMQFLRIYNILKALEQNETMSSRILTDGSLRKHLEKPRSVDSYTEQMEEMLKEISDPEYGKQFISEVDTTFLKSYHESIIKNIFKEF